MTCPREPDFAMHVNVRGSLTRTSTTVVLHLCTLEVTDSQWAILIKQVMTIMDDQLGRGKVPQLVYRIS